MAIFSDDENIQKPLDINKNTKNKNLETKETAFDKSFESNIRPKKLDEYIGQSALKNTLKISIEAAKKRNTPLDHLLFYGPPGLGKTTLASVIANELNANIKITSAPALERPRDIIGILMSLKNGDILFIDEIHRLNKVTEEILYPAMEDFFLDMTTGKAQTVKFYTTQELSQVVTRTAKILDISVDKEGAAIIASRSRGTPRIANRLVKRVADYAFVKSDGKVDAAVAQEALSALNIDSNGLDGTDKALLKLIIEKYDGGPVGLETLAAALGEDSKTIEDVYEPYLLQEGIIQRTPRGRKISPEGYRLMGYKLPTIQQSLF